MTALIAAGFVLVGSFFVMMARINLLRFLAYSTWIDLFFTVLMFVMFSGTFSGIVAASFAGLFMAAGLTACRNALGYERFQRVGFKFKWVYHSPKWVLPGITEFFLHRAHRA